MSVLDEDVIRLHKIWKTLLQMLNDRGYSVADDEVNMTQQQFIEKYGENVNRENLFMYKEKRNNSSDKIFVTFLVSERPMTAVGVKPVRNCVAKMLSENIFNAIVVVQGNVTLGVKKALLNPKPRLEVFQEAELVCNVMEHVLVPEHQVLIDEEKNALLQKYRVKETQLPRMLVTDPVARYYGIRRGKVVKIIRPSENACKYVTYRYVT